MSYSNLYSNPRVKATVPLLSLIILQEKITFIVEVKLLWNKEKEFELENEITFPNSDFALKIRDKRLMVDQGVCFEIIGNDTSYLIDSDMKSHSDNLISPIKFQYIKRKAPLLGYLFDCEEGSTEEKKEHDLTNQNITFQDLVDAFGTLQHHWSFDGDNKNDKNLIIT